MRIMAKYPISTGLPPKPVDLNSEKTDSKDVELYLQTLLNSKRSSALSLSPDYADLLVQMEHLIARGGKRLRPKLVLAAYAAYGGRDRSAIVAVAASQELFHAFILMHDDIIDRDLTRWDGPNISGHYISEFKFKAGPANARHYADAWALLAGDLCFNLSFEALATSGFPPDHIIKAMSLVQQTLFTMVGGELMDVALSFNEAHTADPAPAAEADYLRLCDAKTASYTFCTPLRLGALLAGANADQDAQLLAFGRQLGIAYQLRDDILGIFGDEKTLGKSTLSDIKEAKKTLLLSNFYRLATASQLQALSTIIGNPRATPADLKLVKSALKASGALAQTESVMETICHDAQYILMESDFPLSLSAYLVELLSFCAVRTR
jgi:geranylgeranyl pyrophosphate synthase